MEKLPLDLMSKFIKNEHAPKGVHGGQHTVHIRDGLFNGIWSDMAIETTYMKVGKGPAGILGVTTNERSVAIWSNSHHLCAEVLTELVDLSSKEKHTESKTHKEEGIGRIKSDENDRSKIENSLEKCIHPLETDNHGSNALVNIYTGEESNDLVNVDKAVEIGEKQMNTFQDSLPGSFRTPLSNQVVLMTSSKDKKTKLKLQKAEYNADLLLSRVLLLLGTNQIEFSEVFKYELAAVPPSLFYDSGDARYPNNKSVLMNKLKHEQSSRGFSFNAILIDGGGLLYKIYWPSNGTVGDLVDGLEKYTRKLNADADVFIVFDRYMERSIKSDTRQARIGSFRRCHQLALDRKLPPREMCLSSSATKENLIEINAQELIVRYKNSVSSHKLVIKSKNEVPQEIHYGIEINRTDLRSNFDEADYVIQQQVHSIVKQGDRNSIKIISSDTDAFVLLCSNFLANDWSSANIFMETFIDNSKLININKSVECNKDIVPSLVALHALTGCDSVPMMFGIGKAKGLKVLKETALTCVGKRSCAMKDVFDEGFKFVASCYNRKDPNSSKNRQSLWMMKTDGAHKGSSPPALKSLPPTNEALEMNIMRAHYTAILWNESVSGCMPNIDPCQFGWETLDDEL